MTFSFAGTVFVITGAASGIGLATAQKLLASSASIGICDLNADALSEYVQTLNENEKDRVSVQSVNITRRADVREFLQQTKQKFGKLHGIANVAGTAGHNLGHEEIWQVEDDEYDFVMDVNVRGAFNMLSEGLRPGLLEEPSSIVHTSSMYSQRGFAKGSIYSASKCAGIGLVKSTALEGSKRKIRVNAVTP